MIGRWLDWCDRSKLTLLLASLFLLRGVLHPWYRLPPKVLETFRTSLVFTNLGNFLAAGLLVSFIASILYFRPSTRMRVGVWIGLIVMLLFPFWVTFWHPKIDFLATTLYGQLDDVIFHTAYKFPYVQAQWKHGITLSLVVPPSSTNKFIITDSSFFQWPSLNNLMVLGLGYNNSFFTFVGQGWGWSILGTGLGLLGIYLRIPNSLVILMRDLKKLGLGILFGAILLGLFLMLPNGIDRYLAVKFARGDYRSVVVNSRRLLAWYPPVQGDGSFLVRLAKASFYLDRPDPALSALAQGWEYYQRKNYQKAIEHFQNALAADPDWFIARGYLANSFINAGVRQFNQRNVAAAIENFESALAVFPDSVEALYNLMLARSINGEFEQSALVARQIIDNQAYFQLPSLALLGQAYVHSTWASYHANDLDKAWQEYEKSIDKGAWEKVDPTDS